MPLIVSSIKRGSHMKLMHVSILTAAVALFAVGCGTNNTEGKTEIKSMTELHEQNGVPVRTETIELTRLQSEFSYFSVVSGYEETTANSMVSDEVKEIFFKVGDHVKKDDLVVTFPTDNPAARYYQAKIACEHAETTLKRIQNLYENGGISLQEYDNTRTQTDVARANWETVQQTVTVKAPISGVITNMAVREADNVEPGDVLFTVANTTKLKTWIWASEGQISEIQVGSRATATWQGITIEGKVVQVDLSLDTSKQAFGVVVEFDNPGNRMKSGVNAEVVIQGKDSADVIMTDRKNVLSDGDDHYVYVVENDVAVKRGVSHGRSKGIDVEIIDGLNPGDVLITEGQMLLEDNMKITIAGLQ